MTEITYLRKQLSFEERYKRDTEIVKKFNKRKELGLTVAIIAIDNEITPVQVYNIVRNYNKNYETKDKRRS